PAVPGSGSYTNWEPGQPCPSMIVPVHDGEDAITVRVDLDGQGGIQFENFSLTALEGELQPKRAIGFDCKGTVSSPTPKFIYEGSLRNVSVHGFKRSGYGEAVGVYNSGSVGPMPNGGVGALEVV